MPKEACETAKTLKFFNDLFDVLNGYSKHDKPNPNRILMSDKTHHISFLREAKGKIHQMRFVNKITLLPERTIPCLKNLETTIGSYIAMWNKLKTLGKIQIYNIFFIFFFFAYRFQKCLFQASKK